MTPTGVRSTMRTTSVPGGIVSVAYVSMSGNASSAACTSPESMSGSGVPITPAKAACTSAAGMRCAPSTRTSRNAISGEYAPTPITATSATTAPTTTAQVIRRRRERFVKRRTSWRSTGAAPSRPPQAPAWPSARCAARSRRRSLDGCLRSVEHGGHRGRVSRPDVHAGRVGGGRSRRPDDRDRLGRDPIRRHHARRRCRGGRRLVRSPTRTRRRRTVEALRRFTPCAPSSALPLERAEQLRHDAVDVAAAEGDHEVALHVRCARCGRRPPASRA